MKFLQFNIKHVHLLLVILIASFCASGCAAPLMAYGTTAAGAGIQALAGVAGTAGVRLLGDTVGGAMSYMQGGEQVADVTYRTGPKTLKGIVNKTLREAVSSSFVAFQYRRSYQDGENLFLLSTSTGNELRMVVKDDPSFDDLHATQMVVDMETVEVASKETETSAFVDVLEEIDSETQRQGIDQIRGDFNYAPALST